MYKKAKRQISIADFKQPIGMKMNPENRWVKKADSIPWDEIEERYAGLFKNRKGNVAKPLRLVLGACIIQAEYGYSDEETALQIQEGAYLQYFCGYSEYNDEKMPFDPSLMVYIRKRLTAEILGEINEMIIRKAVSECTSEVEKPTESKDESNNSDNDDDDNNTPPTTLPSNSGTIIVDATCAPSQIKYPQDIELLNEARENTEKMIDSLHITEDGKKPRTYRNRARKDYLSLIRKKKRSSKEIRKAIKKQLAYLRRNLMTIEKYTGEGRDLTAKQQTRLETIQTLYKQQKQMYDENTHSVENRIVSLSQPHIRPIVRGKAKSPVEFGAKLDISVVNGYTRLEKQSFEAYNEATELISVIERYKQRCGYYPHRVLADKIYRNRGNLNWCKKHNIRLSGPALGRPKKDAVSDKVQEYKDNCDRVEVERAFSLAKRKCGLGLIFTRLPETTEHTIALAVIVLNLRKVLYTLLWIAVEYIGIWLGRKKVAFLQ
ncbi:MAG: IS5 family transposase [Eubacteriales bacterium]|nr:IS5 family transposase [Eubacteriales bacterium]